MHRIWPLFFVFILLGSVATGRDLLVNSEQGRDEYDGITSPVKTISRAIKLARPGDTIHLQPVVYHDFAGFSGRHGEPKRPIILDGHGATLDGSQPLDPEGWTEVAPGRFRNDHLLPRLIPSILGRFYFLWDGKVNRMGRTSKGKSVAFKKPSDLKPGEWTFDEVPHPEGVRKGDIAGAFYIQLSPGQSLADAHISIPVRMNGVQLSGKNSHLVIRNITATHVINDGFNIHGDCHDVLFENIRAIECGDDGISAHETARYQVNGLVSIGNSTGICDVGASQTSYQSVVIRDCVGLDLYFLDSGTYSIRNAMIFSKSQSPLTVTARTAIDHPCELKMENVFINRLGPPVDGQIVNQATLTIRQCTLLNMGLRIASAKVTCENSIIAGQPEPKIEIVQNGLWHGKRNLYDLNRMRLHDEIILKGAFKAYQDRTGSEAGSVWKHVETQNGQPVASLAGVGADLKWLEKLKTKIPARIDSQSDSEK